MKEPGNPVSLITAGVAFGNVAIIPVRIPPPKPPATPAPTTPATATSRPAPLGLSWVDGARCQGHNTDLFFDEDTSSATRRAKAICARCPVQAECLAFALETDTLYGVFGGTTGTERERLLRTLKAEV